MTIPPDRLPPRSQEAERAVLGALLRDNTVMDDVLPLVQSASFYEDAHQKIFAVILALHDQNRPADLVTVGEELLQRKQDADIGGLAYLYELWESTPTAANAVYYAEIVRDRALQRGLIHASTEILRDAWDAVQPAAEQLGAAVRKLTELADGEQADEPVHVSIAVAEARARIEERLAGGTGGITGIPTGFADLDRLTAGMQDADLVLIGARPSSGKTALSGAFALHAAVGLGLPTLFVSLEQRRPDLAERMLCNLGRIDYRRVRGGTLTGADVVALNDATTVLNAAPLAIEHTPNLPLSIVKAKARQHQRKHGLRLLLLDYLQEMRAEGNPRENREQQVAAQVKGLKHLAQELNIVVVLLAQLNRASVSEKRRPRLDDFRESGNVEQTADLALLLHPEEFAAEPGQTAAQKYLTVIVAKQRNGETGDVRLVTRFDQMRFENVAQEVPIHRTPFDERD